MEIESQIKMESIRSGDNNIFVGDSFQQEHDPLADSVGTQLTEVRNSSRRADDSILREEQERQSFQKKHQLLNNNLFGESMQSKELKSEQLG